VDNMFHLSVDLVVPNNRHLSLAHATRKIPEMAVCMTSYLPPT